MIFGKGETRRASMASPRGSSQKISGLGLWLNPPDDRIQLPVTDANDDIRIIGDGVESKYT